MRRPFAVWIILNTILLGVCIGHYALLPEWRGSILLSFDALKPFVEVPPGFRYAELVLVVLNIPVVVVVRSTMALVDRLFDLAPIARATLTLVLGAPLSIVWGFALTRIFTRDRATVAQ
jgi:hypothetical protein